MRRNSYLFTGFAVGQMLMCLRVKCIQGRPIYIGYNVVPLEHTTILLELVTHLLSLIGPGVLRTRTTRRNSSVTVGISLFLMKSVAPGSSSLELACT